MAIACGWGFAEATLFFLVPDIWLSYLALKDGRRALRASLWAVGGALVGGVVMYEWSLADAQSARAAVEHVPGIGAEMFERGGVMLREHGVWSLFPAMLRGMPYKIFAVQAPPTGIPLTVLLLATVPARLARFTLVSAMTHVIVRRVLGGWSARAHVMTWTIWWTAFYTAYFAMRAG